MNKYLFDLDYKAPFAKKFTSDFVDLLLIIFCSFLFTFLGNYAFQNTTYYQEQVQIIELNSNGMRDLAKQAGLTDRDGNTGASVNEELFNDYLCSNILLSYTLDEASFNEADISSSLIEEKLQYTVIADFDNDPLAYFYLYFLDGYDGKTDIEDKKISYVKLLKQQDNAEDIYDFSRDYPSFKSEVAIDIFNHLFTDTKEPCPSYNTVKTIFNDVFMNSINIFRSLPSYLAFYQAYDKAYLKLVNINNLVLTISYTISFGLIFVIPPIFIKNGQTIGKKINEVILIDKREEKVKVYQLVIRDILTFINFFFIIILPALFITGIQSFSYGSLPFFIFPLISFVLCLVNVIFNLTNKDVNSVVDILSSSRLIMAYKGKGNDDSNSIEGNRADND